MAARKRRKKTASKTTSPPATHPTAAERTIAVWRPTVDMILSAAVVALFVARVMFPSESAADGDGLPLIMLWLVLAVLWCISVLLGKTPARRLTVLDATVFALVGWHTVSALVAMGHGNAHSALNMMWQWIALGVAFFLTRQLIRRSRDIRAVMAVMVALATALAVYGLYEYYVTMPATRALYATSPEQALRDAGLWLAPDSPERMVFEKRLASTEPLATFALTNSLAGFLAPWLVLLTGAAVLQKKLWTVAQPMTEADQREAGFRRVVMFNRGSLSAQSSRKSRGVWLALVLAGGTITTCLLLTKSRSAYVATLIGWILIGGLSAIRSRRIGWKIPLAVTLAVILLIVVAATVGGLDREILSEAKKSLGYRLEYWEATGALIAEHPWLGCGPGQFQDTYTAYKLPQASEEIADPHNFLLEVWATAGTPAALALVVVLGLFTWHLVRGIVTQSPPLPATDNTSLQRSDTIEGKTGSTGMIYAGALVGALLAWPVALLSAFLPSPALWVLGIPVAAVVLWLLHNWVRLEQDETAILSLAGVALAVLLVHLLAAGGIGFPGIAGTLWLLLALGMNGSEASFDNRFLAGRPPTLPTDSPTTHITKPRQLNRTHRLMVGGGLILFLSLGLLCYATAYRPVLESHREICRALDNPREASRRFRAAARANPRWPEPWKRLTVWLVANRSRPWREAEASDFRQAATAWTLRAPHSAAAWATIGDGYRSIFEDLGHQDDLLQAADAHRKAVLLYPNNAVYHAKYALVLKMLGDTTAFHREAKTALELDAATPHTDKKLPPFLRDLLSIPM